MAGDPPTGFVLKAYKTEADAIADSNALKVTANTAYVINLQQAAAYNFFTHVKYYFRIEANEAVKEFYIDWDDGEDNDPKGNANYTLIKFDNPQFVGITSHIFTRDKVHYPKIRVMSAEGYLSKFYQADGDTTFKGIDVMQGETAITAGRNNTYRIENDVTSAEGIPVFGPTPRPPVGVLKADKKRVFAGITNKYLAGPTGDYTGKTVQLIGSHSSMNSARNGVKVNVTAHVMSSDQNDLTNTGSGELVVTEMTMGGTNTIDNVLKVVKMELINLLEDDKNMTSSEVGSAATNKLYPGEKLLLCVNDGTNFVERPCIVGEVSLGNPIVTLDDPKHSVTLDATESFARSPETTIDEYRIWDGDKLTNFGYNENEAVLAASSTNISDIFGAGAGRDTLRAPLGVKTTSYAFHPMLTFTDKNHRWLPQQLLAMCQVKSSEAAINADAINDSRATYQYSFLEHWVDESQSNNYGEDRDGVTDGYSWPDDMRSSAFMAFRGADDEDNWDDLNPFNRLVGEDNQHALFQQTAGSTHTDADRLYGKAATLDTAGAEGGYLVCARDSRWTKQHFQTRTGTKDATDIPYRAGPITANTHTNKTLNDEWTGVGHAGVRVEIFYTAQEDSSSNIIWKPLKYLNKTKHPLLDDSTFYTSGCIEWEEPEDWVACDPGDIPDRFWPGGDFEAGGSVAFSFDSDASGNYFDVSNRWNATNKKYGLLWVIAGDGAAASAHSRFGYGPDVTYTFPASNQHSVLIDVIDPMHVSLNDRAIAQSVSFTHKGKYQIIEDRMGMSEIRKIGASGGALKFGGIDLKDSDKSTYTRDEFYDYMRTATPVYLDVSHKSGNISRFFGVITSMSEDKPVGLQNAKFGIDMVVSHMIYMDSTGTILSDGYVSLGGDMIDEFKYI